MTTRSTGVIYNNEYLHEYILVSIGSPKVSQKKRIHKSKPGSPAHAHGLPWLGSASNGFPWISLDSCGFPWLVLQSYQIQSHLQLDPAWFCMIMNIFTSLLANSTWFPTNLSNYLPKYQFHTLQKSIAVCDTIVFEGKWPISYGLYTAVIRPVYGHYTVLIRPLYGPYTALICPSICCSKY